MSGLAGRLSFDNVPTDPDYISRLGRSLSRLGLDQEPTTSHLGAATLIYRATYTTLEEKLTTQPFMLSTVVSTLDGRLDNRADLARALGVSGSLSDVEIVIRAYLKWGEQFCSRLLGDFALAIWDESQSKLLLARDPFGVKALYFTTDRHSISWCSTPEGLLHARISSDINELFLASYLSLSAQPSISPFRAIDALKPGTVLVANKGALKCQEFWTIQNCLGTVRYETDQEYEEHLLAVLKESVSARLRGNGPVIAELSGGLDSSSIACLAHIINGETGTPDDSLRTLSLLMPLWGDEEYYISQVEEQLSCKSFHIKEDPNTIFSPNVDKEFTAYPTFLSFCPARRKVIDVALRNGSRVILSGEFGDAVFRQDEAFPVELLSRLRRTPVRQLFSVLLSWAISENTTIWNLLWKAVAFRRRLSSIESIPAWISKQFAVRCGLLEFMHELSKPICGITERYASQYCEHLLWCRACLAGRLTYETSSQYIEARYPYIDLRLISFLGSIPPDQLWRPHERRSIMRRSLRGILPEAVRTRMSKGNLEGVLMAGFEKNWNWIDSLIKTSILVGRGYVIEDELRKVFAQTRNGIGSPFFGLLLRFVAAEVWLRNVSALSSEV